MKIGEEYSFYTKDGKKIKGVITLIYYIGGDTAIIVSDGEDTYTDIITTEAPSEVAVEWHDDEWDDEEDISNTEEQSNG